MELEGKVAVVTGGASGVGFAIAKCLAAAGANIALADVDAVALDRARVALTPTEVDVLTHPTDVSDQGSVESLAGAVRRRFGAVHVLINNAGVTLKGRIWELSLDDWRWVHGVCFWGALHGIRSFVPWMIEQGNEGHVQNVASMAGFLTRGGSGPYDTAKQGLVGLTESLELEFRAAAPFLKASLLCPGYVATNIGESARHRPARFGTSGTEASPRSSDSTKRRSPEAIAELAVASIQQSRFAAFADWSDWRPAVAERFQRILDQQEPAVPVFP